MHRLSGIRRANYIGRTVMLAHQHSFCPDTASDDHFPFASRHSAPGPIEGCCGGDGGEINRHVGGMEPIAPRKLASAGGILARHYGRRDGGGKKAGGVLFIEGKRKGERMERYREILPCANIAFNSPKRKYGRDTRPDRACIFSLPRVRVGLIRFSHCV